MRVLNSNVTIKMHADGTQLTAVPDLLRLIKEWVVDFPADLFHPLDICLLGLKYYILVDIFERSASIRQSLIIRGGHAVQIS